MCAMPSSTPLLDLSCSPRNRSASNKDEQVVVLKIRRLGLDTPRNPVFKPYQKPSLKKMAFQPLDIVPRDSGALGLVAN